ncbi:HD domain-containing phosphohydrolase [Clostridium ljungdahlii]|uniref:Cyclic di-GMP phosphodiesterase response regulator RpfG n=1 Tax=Clostridium ljungdahlii TaxID=1538 RepID=A0A162J4R5_9CLOT|nr:HD domain-containing phosphohydrolase [Clostridium ljungdahlii]OAA90285.1 Cyclic di-GMP phosphodiesterase response regulator RpfG [Clostridium ljungdahlii]
MLVSIRKKIYSIFNKDNKLWKYESIRICLIFLGISLPWVYFSDRIAIKFASDDNMFLAISTYKGCVYVVVTSFILYLLISNLLKKIALVEKKLNESYKELSLVNEELKMYVKQLANSKKELRMQYDKISKSENKLSKSEEKNRAIIKALPDTLFVVDNKGYLIDCMSSDEKYVLMPKKDFIGKNILEVLPKKISEKVYEKMQVVLNKGILDSFEYKVWIRNKEYYFEIRMVKNNEKEVLAISRNVTDERQNEMELKLSEATFRNLFENSSDAILIISDGNIVDCNLAMIKALGYDSKTFILGKNPLEFYPEKQPDGEITREKVIRMRKNTIENGKCKFEWWYKKADGNVLPVEVMLTTIFLNGKKVFHSLWRDIRDRKEMELKLEYLSYRDQLTGLYNRRFFEAKLNRLDVERILPLTIVMGDVNGLKLVNDSLGHVMGDKLLKKVAEVIKKGCRKDDITARWGGDEFVILLPKTDAFQTEQILKRIKSIAAKEKIGAIDISISFGYETKKSRKVKIQETFKKAENYMYKKKLFEGPNMIGKTISAIITALHEKNKREEEHSHRVSILCKDMGEALGLLGHEIKELKTVGLLHDIGKVAIEENILNKPGKLTDEEWQEIKRHPEIGYRILNTVDDMSEIADYVLAHHERWDGKGYPKGLKEKEIPLQSRIIAIADSYDAMTSERSYRSPLSEEIAIGELKLNAGTQFDPELTSVFIEKVLDKLHCKKA